MCGFVGMFFKPGEWPGKLAVTRALMKMSEDIMHRGPDDQHFWMDERSGICLAFRRLSILDLSVAGRQPMTSICERWTLVFNGEVYNHKELKAKLQREKNVLWRGTSDTEILLEYLAFFGLKKTVSDINGMFSIVAWDSYKKKLWLVRDRVGEKPLYYAQSEKGTFLFSSEARVLKNNDYFYAEIDRDVAKNYLQFGYVPDPLCIYKRAKKLLPGHLAEIGIGKDVKNYPYWDITEKYHTSVRNKYKGIIKDAISDLDTRLKEAIAIRLRADVEIGSFLSGGIDSSTVTSIYKQILGDIKTFSVGFDDPQMDESQYAKKVADHLSSNHSEIKIKESDCMEIAKDMAHFYDEPFSDPSQIPTVLLCRYAKKHLSVALSGDGGDELFGGYPRYKKLATRWKNNSKLPFSLRKFSNVLQKNLSGMRTYPIPSIRKKLRHIGHLNPENLYLDELSRWRPDQQLIISDNNLSRGLWGRKNNFFNNDMSLSRNFMLHDFCNYLPSNLLVKTDRASMAFGLEVRAPFLDHNLLEFVWSLPGFMTYQDGKKGILNMLLRKKIPEKLVSRPKQGFEPPLAKWLREGLKNWAGDLLSTANRKNDGLYDIQYAMNCFDKHNRGGKSLAYPIWTVIMFESWRENNGI